MKKKIVFALICICFFAAGFLISEAIPRGNAINDGINRSHELIYPPDEYLAIQGTYIFPDSDDIYFHDDLVNCYFAPYTRESRPLDISTYEAIERGYKPCPNCATPAVELWYGQWDKLIKRD